MTNQGNGFDGQAITGYLNRIDEADDELESLRGDYMNQCKGPRGTIKLVKQEARDAGLNMNAFNEVLTLHREARAAEKRKGELEPEDIDDLEAMQEALGPFAETELGAAAIAKAKRKANESALDGLGG